MNGKFRKLLKGYGFIAGDDGIDYFFHWQDMSKFTLQLRYCEPNMPVDFEVKIGDRGPRAVNIKVLGHTLDPKTFSEVK